jgi:hypothetical protein
LVCDFISSCTRRNINFCFSLAGYSFLSGKTYRISNMDMVYRLYPYDWFYHLFFIIKHCKTKFYKYKKFILSCHCLVIIFNFTLKNNYPLLEHLWCILVAKYGAFLFTEIGAFVITDYRLVC